MPLPTLDTTVGGANANSYVDVATADAFLDARLNSSAWTNATADDKTRALLMAASRLEIENWLGQRVTTTQRLAWPRWGARKRDGITFSFFGYQAYGWSEAEEYLTTEIPQPVKGAQCELALAYLEDFEDGGGELMDSFSTDGVTVKLKNSKPDGGLPARVSQLIGGLIAGNMLIRG